MKPNPQLISTLSELLDRLTSSRKLSNDEQEVISDEVSAEAKKLPSDGFLEALDAAVGKNKFRRKESIFLLAEFAYFPEVSSRIGEEFNNPDPKWRGFIAQIVRLRHLESLAPNLSLMIEADPDTQCRIHAIGAAGHLRSPCNLPILLKLAESPPKEVQWALTVALKEYAPASARRYFENLFQNPKTDKSLRVIAAWGLAKLGDNDSLQYLAELLFDPDITTPTSFTHGQSFRAAQAICDLKKWHFEWNRTFIHKHREEWKKLLAQG